ncbi:MAG: hypothetical protein HQK49_20240 [Oligoflexia bacterium]|nr:hypothetical protein [Oligoflexia bacterium]
MKSIKSIKKKFITTLTLTLTLLPQNITWGQTQTGQTSQGGPVYNFQFYNTPTPAGTTTGLTTSTQTAPAAQAAIAAPAATQPPTAVATTNANAPAPKERGNNWIPSVGYFLMNSANNTLGLDKKDPVDSYTGYAVSLKIPMGTSFSLVPKFLISKKDNGASNDSSASSVYYNTGYGYSNSYEQSVAYSVNRMKAIGLDLRYDHYSGNYLGTGMGLSLLGYSKEISKETRGYYNETENNSSKGLAAGFFLAPNLTVGIFNIEALAQIGYQLEKENASSNDYHNGYSYESEGKTKNKVYTMLMLNVGITI